MERLPAKNDIIQQLQREVISLQGYKRSLGSDRLHTGLGALEKAFPGNTFPTGAVHEFLSHAAEDAAATNGFVAGLLGRLMEKRGACLWISTRRTIFPPALKLFGINPERIVFIDPANQKDALWAVEEALKCESLSAVVGELTELDFKESRRLQLAVENSRVTGFIHRYNPGTNDAVACITRWKIKHLPSETEDGMPGLGFPRWEVQLLKVRNGRPGSWQIEWSADGFRHIAAQEALTVQETLKRKAG